MKKILTVLALGALMFGTQSISNALTSTKVDDQKGMNQETVNQIMTRKQAKSAQDEAIVMELAKRYINNLRTCEPLHFNQHLDIFGFKMDVNIDINGWVDNKCNYSLNGKVGGFGKDLKEVLGISVSDEAVSKVEPKIECNFTKQDLDIVVDALIASNNRNEVAVSNILKSPEKKYSQNNKPQMTPEEEKLIMLLAGGEACKIINKDELFKNFTDLMNSGGI